MTGRLPSASTISKLNRDTESLLFLAPGNLFHAGAMVRYGQKTRARDTKELVCSSGKHATGFLKEIPSRIRAETLFRICNLIHIRVLSLLGLRLILYCEHLYGLPPRGWHASWWHTHTHTWWDTQHTQHTLQRTNKQIYLRRPLHSAHRAADQSASARRGVGAGLLSPLLLLLLILILLPLLLLLLLLLLPGAAKATTMGVVAEGCSSVF